MNKLLNEASKAWAGATLNVKKFADAYTDALDKYGQEAQERFASTYPMFGDREWHRLKMIGYGELLPQLFFKSDFFVNKIVRLRSSMRIQKALVGASNDGRIRVDRGNGPESVYLSDLTKGEEKALALLLSEENEKLSSSDLRLKYRSLICKINKANKSPKPVWEIREVNGCRIVHFNRACNLNLHDINTIKDALEKNMKDMKDLKNMKNAKRR